MICFFDFVEHCIPDILEIFRKPELGQDFFARWCIRLFFYNTAATHKQIKTKAAIDGKG